MNNKNLTIHVANNSVMALYIMEMEGQISDGKYENSRPFDHWKWVSDVKNIVVDKCSGISGDTYSRFGYHHKSYNLREWITYINNWRKKGDVNTRWATRIFAFAKFGKIYDTMSYETMTSLNGLSILLEDLQIRVEMGDTDPMVLFEKCTDFSTCAWRQKYYDSCKEYFTLDFIKKFMEMNYTMKDLKNDLDLMYSAINNPYMEYLKYFC